MKKLHFSTHSCKSASQLLKFGTSSLVLPVRVPPPRLTSDSDLISMCQRCSSSLCRFSTAFCFCFFSLLSCSFLARLLGLISTGSSGFTFFYRGTENMWWTCSLLLCLFTDYPTAFFFPFQVSITDLNLRLVLDSWDGTTPLRTRFHTNTF